MSDDENFDSWTTMDFPSGRKLASSDSTTLMSAAPARERRRRAVRRVALGARRGDRLRARRSVLDAPQDRRGLQDSRDPSFLA